MITIHKHVLPEFHNTIYFPQCAEIMSCKIQRGQAVLYVRLDTNDAPIHEVLVSIFATGEELPIKGMKFVDTIEYSSGYVGHVFYSIESNTKTS